MHTQAFFRNSDFWSQGVIWLIFENRIFPGFVKLSSYARKYTLEFFRKDVQIFDFFSKLSNRFLCTVQETIVFSLTYLIHLLIVVKFLCHPYQKFHILYSLGIYHEHHDIFVNFEGIVHTIRYDNSDMHEDFLELNDKSHKLKIK